MRMLFMAPLLLMGCAQIDAQGYRQAGVVRVEPHPTLPEQLRILWEVPNPPGAVNMSFVDIRTPEARQAALRYYVPERCVSNQLIEEGRRELAPYLGGRGRELIITRVACPS